MTAATGISRTTTVDSYDSYDELVARVRSGQLGPAAASQRIAIAFTTRQTVRHDGRGTGYRNEVLILRLAGAVGRARSNPGRRPTARSRTVPAPTWPTCWSIRCCPCVWPRWTPI